MSGEEGAIRPSLHNVVATCDLCAKLDLRKIGVLARNTEYTNTRSRESLVMRILRPPELRCTATVFSSGKLRVMGTRSVESARTAARRIARSIQRAGQEVRFTGFTIQTVMASCDVRFPIHLERLKHVYQFHCTYEPEVNSSLVYRVLDGVVLNIFATGKIMITKARSEEDVQRAFDDMYPVLLKFRKQKHETTADDLKDSSSPIKVSEELRRASGRANGLSRGRGRGRGKRAAEEASKSPPSKKQVKQEPINKKPPSLESDDEALGSDDDDDELMALVE